MNIKHSQLRKTSCVLLRDNQHELGGFSIDVKAAHKRVVIKESARGLLGFSHNDQLYFYRVAPFGAIFNAHWWGRIGAFLVRLLHSAVYIKHALWLYVDDFLLTQRMDILPITAALVSILLLLFAIRISWKKCTLAKEVTWIGWCFNFFFGHSLTGYAEALQTAQADTGSGITDAYPQTRH